MSSRKSSTKPATGTKARLNTLEKKAQESKKDILEQLSKTPVIIAAIQASGVGRSTYYKWRKEDLDFEKSADDAIKEGRKFVNDIAISKLMQLINDGCLTAIIFWLKNNHTWFAEKIRHEHEHHLVGGDRILTEEQRDQLIKAQRLSGMAAAAIIHEELKEKFLASPKHGQTHSEVQTPAHITPDEDRISDWGTGKPQAKFRKELERNGINIQEFLKKYKKP